MHKGERYVTMHIMVQSFENGESKLPPSGVLYMIATQRILDEHAKWLATGLSLEEYNVEPDYVLEPGTCGDVFFEGRYERESAVEMYLPSLPLINPKPVTLNCIRYWNREDKFDVNQEEAAFTLIELSVFNNYKDSLGWDHDNLRILLSPESPPVIELDLDSYDGHGPIYEYMNEGQKGYREHIDRTLQDPADRLIALIFDAPKLKWPGRANLTEEECLHLVGLIKNDTRKTTPDGP